jgi:cullin-4
MSIKLGKDSGKKLVIRPFKSQPKLPDNYEEETWIKLSSAIHAVHSKISAGVSKEELYRVSGPIVQMKSTAVYLYLRKTKLM